MTGLIALQIHAMYLVKNVMVPGNFCHNREANLFRVKLNAMAVEVRKMRFMIAALMATASFLSPLTVFADSADVEATIKSVSTEKLSLTLDDGKTYSVPEEFNFEGLQAGVKVIVFYTEVDGRRVVDDLEVVQ